MHFLRANRVQIAAMFAPFGAQNRRVMHFDDQLMQHHRLIVPHANLGSIRSFLHMSSDNNGCFWMHRHRRDRLSSVHPMPLCVLLQIQHDTSSRHGIHEFFAIVRHEEILSALHHIAIVAMDILEIEEILWKLLLLLFIRQHRRSDHIDIAIAVSILLLPQLLTLALRLVARSSSREKLKRIHSFICFAALTLHVGSIDALRFAFLASFPSLRFRVTRMQHSSSRQRDTASMIGQSAMFPRRSILFLLLEVAFLSLALGVHHLSGKVVHAIVAALLLLLLLTAIRRQLAAALIARFALCRLTAASIVS
mmetsp:Transcript_31417/g.50548  ORF Transcript_31417/g.50548 Transcript_31417/m.50548 type:complete len:308 (-) Transcript_31417:721-1644(-)